MKMQSIFKLGGLVLTFAHPFEMIANISVQTREQGPLFPLSYQGINTRIMSDSLGYRSSIYRGQPKRWAVFGTSYLFSPQVHQEDLWSRKIEEKYAGQVHIANFSYAGSTHTVAETIRQSVERNEAYDKVFLVLTIGLGEVATPIPLPEVFTTTGRFFPYVDDSGALTSVKILKRLAKPEVQRLKASLLNFIESVFRLGRPALASAGAQASQNVDPWEYLDQERLGDFKECYQREMIQRKCEARYHDVIPAAATTDQRWKLYEAAYLPCQKQADHACGVKQRHDEVPRGYYGNQSNYRRQIARLVDMAKPLSPNIYLLIRAVGSGDSMEPDTLAYHTWLVAGEINSKYVVLSTKTSAKLERLRNQELYEAALMYKSQNPSITIFNLQNHFDAEGVSALHFRDYPHISKDGNRLVADYLLNQFKDEK